MLSRKLILIFFILTTTTLQAQTSYTNEGGWVDSTNGTATPLQWWARYNGPASQNDYGRAVKIDNKGNVYIAGSSEGIGTGMDYAVVKYNSNGTQLWTARYNGNGNGDDECYALAVDADENVYITGQSQGDSTGIDYATVKFDSNGVKLWVALYNGPGGVSSPNNSANDIALDKWGNVYVTGTSTGDSTGEDYATVKYNSQGQQVWVERYNGLANNANAANEARTMTVRNQYIYVSGGSGIGSNYDYATVKYDTAGNQEWVARYTGYDSINGTNGYNLVYYQGCVVVDSFDNVYITGYSYDTLLHDNYATIKYDSSGNQLWVNRFNSQSGGTSYADAITVDRNLNVYVTGGSFRTATNYDFCTIKYNSQGLQQWIAYYNGTGNNWDEAYNIVTDDSLNIYITGRSPGATTNADFVTVKYDSSGNQKWSSRNGSVNYDWPWAIRLDKAGNIYVGGQCNLFVNDSTDADFLLIKFGSWPNGITQISPPMNSLSLFPNPAYSGSSIHLQYYIPGDENISFIVYNELGIAVKELPETLVSHAGQQNAVLNMEGLPSGIYSIVMKENSGITSSCRVVLMK